MSKKIKRQKQPLLTDEDMKPENIKVNITLTISGAVLDYYREVAKNIGVHYTDVMEFMLFDHIIQASDET